VAIERFFLSARTSITIGGMNLKRVLIIEAQIKQYRLPFYERLFASLHNDGIELRVAYSDPPPDDAAKKDTCDLPWHYGLKVRGHWLLRDNLFFQAVVLTALKSDLVVIDQANKFLLNYLLLPLGLLGVKRVAFFGHGKNDRDDRLRFSEWYRRNTLNWVSWWFAYTQSTTNYLVANGVPSSKITTVNNAVDTNEIREQVVAMSEQQKSALRSSLGIPLTSPVGIYCGALDEVKKVPFLIDAAKLIRSQIPGFHLLLVGGGPEQRQLESAIREHPWIHSMGPRFGKEKSGLLAISDVLLMPGAVGLVILDAFAAGLPLLSTRLKIHGPEMEYLVEGRNGLLSEPEVPAFADMVSSLLSDREALARLQCGARESGAKYTIDNMAANFELGIRQCLGVWEPVCSHSPA
jgi:glycosyltransferase involved in cell wall biosynthesis